jgi:outer membrane protein assembly factor BamB
MSSPPPRRRRRGLLVALLALLLLAGGAAAYVIAHEPGDVSNPDVEFTAPDTTATAPKPKPKLDDFLWPTYGFTADRTRDFSAAPRYLRPPFRRGWTYRGDKLIEFPPAIEGAALYLLDDGGMLRAIEKTSGRILWRQRVGRLAAASPAAGDGRVYTVTLTGIGSATGRVAAYRAGDGRQAWSKALPSRAESSPLLRDGKLYFGSEDGTLYALRASDGKTLWTYQAGGSIKGGPALADGILYFGDYSGHVHAVRARNGKQVWSVGTSGTRFGFGSGRFYSTAAVAFGRVYLGNTDGRVYSFAAHSGKLAWATGTGAYVYGSPAVSNVKGLGPTVYIGSYDGTFYAFDARSGAVRWRTPLGYKISGSGTIVGGVVYISHLGTYATVGLDVRTGRKRFDFSDGAFNAAVADERAVYLAGFANLYELLPQRQPPSWKRAQVAAVDTARRAATRRTVPSQG